METRGCRLGEMLALLDLQRIDTELLSSHMRGGVKGELAELECVKN